MKIAVIIPALDEVQYITRAVESAARAPESQASRPGPACSVTAGAEARGVEVVVVDGGSLDGTPERALAAGARVVRTGPGRARQLRRGVLETDAAVVVLLHADTRLPPGWDVAVEEALADADVVGGAFRLRFAEPGRRLRWIEWGVRLRVALFGLPYGDQAIFVRRAVLDEVGGVPDVELMEDLDLVQALKTRGRLRLLPLPVTTSARRYLRAGIARTVARHQLAVLAWALGVDRLRIARWVRG